MGAVHERAAPLLKKGGDAISHLVRSSPSTTSCTLNRARDSLSLGSAREGTTAANLIEHTHSFPQSAVLLTQCLIRANRFLATEQT